MNVKSSKAPNAPSTAVALSVLACGAALAHGAESPERAVARELLALSEVAGGLVVHAGCGDGKLTAALHPDDRYLVHGLAGDPADVDRARAHIQAAGLYGKVSVAHWTPPRLPYAANLVNLLVVEDPGGLDAGEIMRVLAPRGVACVRRGGRWAKTIKPWPAEIDEWTHWLHGPDGNAVSRDVVVGPLRHLQWAARPLWSRHHDTVPSVSAMVSSHGRVFYIVDEAPAGIDGRLADRWSLTARDAFNGVMLWKRPMPEWGWKQWSATWHARFNQPTHLPKRLVAVGEVVYVTLGYRAPLSALDASTGRTVTQYDGTACTDEILYHEGKLILAVNREAPKPAGRNSPAVEKDVCLVDAETGMTLWKKGPYAGLRSKADSVSQFGRLELAAGGGRAFLADHDALVCLDLTSGAERWRVARPEVREYVALFGMRMNDLCVLVCHDEVVLFAQPEMQLRDPWHSIPGTLYAYSAADGRLLWKHLYGGWSHFYQPDVFVIDGLVWIHEHQEAQEGEGKKLRKHQLVPKMDALDYAVLGLDPRTGERRRRFSTRETFNVGHHHRCHRNRATRRYLLTSRRGVEFLDLGTGENHLHHWTRGGCLFGIVPSNGLLYVVPHPCDCYIAAKLNGIIAMAPEQATAPIGRPHADGDRLERGPAYASGPPLAGGYDSEDWPTYRHDAARSGSSVTRVPAEFTRLWEAKTASPSSAPVVAGGTLLVAHVDGHRIIALDARNGTPLWTFTAGGRVDSPPTLHRGLALFGSSDGWAYCVRATDGRLVWRRRVAPAERLVGAYGQLESAWPAHGSMLVDGGVAYLAAGRSSYLDGGIRLCALDPVTGQLKRERTVYSPDPETAKMPRGDAFTLPGALADILVSGGSAIYMRQMKVFDGGGQKAPPVNSTAGFLDDSWFNRTRWAIGAVSHAQLLVFDEQHAYGVNAYPGTKRAAVFRPGTEGYQLFAAGLRRPARGAGADARPRQGKRAPMKPRWSCRVPIRITAMALCGEVLCAAGTPDLIDPKDSLAALEGRKGGVLCAYAASDGSKLSELTLDAPPVFDGMIAARGRLYISTRDGHVVCVGAK